MGVTIKKGRGKIAFKTAFSTPSIFAVLNKNSRLKEPARGSPGLDTPKRKLSLNPLKTLKPRPAHGGKGHFVYNPVVPGHNILRGSAPKGVFSELHNGSN